jgi:hypothetical protein
MTRCTGWPGQLPAWRDAVQVACIDLCSIHASAVRHMLPHATLTADLPGKDPIQLRRKK